MSPTPSPGSNRRSKRSSPNIRSAALTTSYPSLHSRPSNVVFLLIVVLLCMLGKADSTNADALKLSIDPNSVEYSLVWSEVSNVDSLVKDILFGVALTEDATSGWAVGATVQGENNNRGVIYDYSVARGWQRDIHSSSVAHAPLFAMWLHPNGKSGWAVGAYGEILEYDKNIGWRRHSQSGTVYRHNLNAVWMNDDGSGWAIGGYTHPREAMRYNAAAILRYSGEKGWSLVDTSSTVTNKELLGMWFNGSDDTGWAVGRRGTILKYTSAEGWKTDQSASQLTGLDLYAVWMNDDATKGWAVGGSAALFDQVHKGVILQYSEETSWQHYPGAGQVEASALRSIRTNQEGSRGWIVGESNPNIAGSKRMVAKLTRDNLWQRVGYSVDSKGAPLYSLWLSEDVSKAWAVGMGIMQGLAYQESVESVLISPLDQADFAMFQGTFLVTFPEPVVGSPTVTIVSMNGDSATPTTTIRYTLQPRNGSPTEFVLSVPKTRSALSGAGFYGIEVHAKIGSDLSSAEVVFKGDLEIEGSTPTERVDERGSDVLKWLVGFLIVLLGAALLNVVLVLCAIKTSWMRTIILHRLWARVVSMLVGKYIIIDPLILFVGPIRRGLLGAYREAVQEAVPELTGWTSRASYVSPKVTLGKQSDVETGKGESDTYPMWLQALDAIVSMERGIVWFVEGPSGLGKTALLENWLIAALEKEGGLIPFLVRLGEGLTPTAEVTLLLSQYGDIPWSPERPEEVERVDDLLNRGGCLLLLDGLNEDPEPERTLMFIRRMVARNVIVVTSQYAPRWGNVHLKRVDLLPFEREQLEKVIPKEWQQEVLRASHLKSIASLPQSSLLLARYIRDNGSIPDAANDVYYELCKEFVRDGRIESLEEQAWEMFRGNREQFQTSDAIPEEEVCQPGVESGLLTLRETKKGRVYKFSHGRIHSYMVARFLYRQEHRLSIGWCEEIEGRIAVSRKDDVMELLAEMISEGTFRGGEAENDYYKFLTDAARFQRGVFEDRLYPQYKRLQAAGRVGTSERVESLATSTANGNGEGQI